MPRELAAEVIQGEFRGCFCWSELGFFFVFLVCLFALLCACGQTAGAGGGGDVRPAGVVCDLEAFIVVVLGVVVSVAGCVWHFILILGCGCADFGDVKMWGL